MILEEKAEEYLQSIEGDDCVIITDREERKQAYIAGAKELEKENNKLLDVINNQDVKIADLEQQIEKMKCCGNCGNKRCTSKYRGNSAYHTQTDGFACAENEDWVMRIKENGI